MLCGVSVLSGLVCVDTTSVVPRPQCESWLLQTCASQKGLFVSGWDWLATSALLAPPQTLARVQMLEPGQASHLCSPSQTKRLYTVLTLLSPSFTSQTGLQQFAKELMLISIPSIDPDENFLSNAWVPIELCDFLKLIGIFSWQAKVITFSSQIFSGRQLNQKKNGTLTEWSNYAVLNNVIKSIMKSKLLIFGEIFAVQSIRITTDCYIASTFIIHDICWYNYIAFLLAGSLSGSICSVFLVVIMLKFCWQNMMF